MDKYLANYLGQPNNDFPVDCETMDYINQRVALCEALGALGGDKIILSGCVDNGTTRTAGYIFLKTTDFPEGEVLPFEGGNSALTFMIQKSNVDITAEGETYSAAYTKRSAVVGGGVGSETYNWSDMTDISNISNKALKSSLNTLSSTNASEHSSIYTQMYKTFPVGAIVLWPSATAPDSGYWLKCNGGTYQAAFYTKLASVLGHTGVSAPLPNIPPVSATIGSQSVSYYYYIKALDFGGIQEQI